VQQVGNGCQALVPSRVWARTARFAFPANLLHSTYAVYLRVVPMSGKAIVKRLK